MKTVITGVLCVAIAAVPIAGAQDMDEHYQRAVRILTETPLIDGHNDLPWAIREYVEAPRDVEAYNIALTTPGHTDLDRLGRGLVGGQFWSVYVPGEWADSGYARVQLEQLDIARRIIAKYPDLELAGTADDVERIFRQGRIASIIGLEGGHVIENSLGALRIYYELGARYMTLTHNVTLDWADAASDEPTHDGLTAFGEEVVREMNRLGMLVDLSHVSPATMSDALNVTEAPVIFSHSSARALTDHVRNVPDSILARLSQNGGVVMVTFAPPFVSQDAADYRARMTAYRDELEAQTPDDSAEVQRALDAWLENNPRPKATIGQVADHIERVRDVAGIDHVGIGADYDGVSYLPTGLDDVSTYPFLFAELSRREWSDADLRKLAGENILQAMRAAETVAAQLQERRPPSTKTIEELDGA